MNVYSFFTAGCRDRLILCPFIHSLIFIHSHSFMHSAISTASLLYAKIWARGCKCRNMWEVTFAYKNIHVVTNGLNSLIQRISVVYSRSGIVLVAYVLTGADSQQLNKYIKKVVPLHEENEPAMCEPCNICYLVKWNLKYIILWRSF